AVGIGAGVFGQGAVVEFDQAFEWPVNLVRRQPTVQVHYGVTVRVVERVGPVVIEVTVHPGDLLKRDIEVPHAAHHWRAVDDGFGGGLVSVDRKSTRLNSSHVSISYAVCCVKKTKGMRFMKH